MDQSVTKARTLKYGINYLQELPIESMVPFPWSGVPIAVSRYAYSKMRLGMNTVQISSGEITNNSPLLFVQI